MTEIQERSSKKTGARKPAPRPQSAWSPDKFDAAVKLAADGKSAREIAKVLGSGFTRSSVICKLRRHEVTLATEPSGGRGIPRQGITKGSGKNAQGRIPTMRTETRAASPSSAPEFEGAEVSALAVTMDVAGSIGGLGLRQSRVIVVAMEPIEWEEDRVEMARQLIEVKKLSFAQAAQQMGVQTQDMVQVCRQQKIQLQRTPRIKILRQENAAPAPLMKISRETPTALDLTALTKLDEAFDAAPKATLDADVVYEPVPFLEATSTTCKFIVGKGNDGLATYCGCPASRGESWCRSHRSIVFSTRRA